jgi:hypothetical protein
MSHFPSRHIEDLKLLPLDEAFVFRDHIPNMPGGKIKYWTQNGIIEPVGWVRIDCRNAVRKWVLTDKARRFLE